MKYDAALHHFQSCNDFSFRVIFGIPTRNEHYGSCPPWVEFYRFFIEVFICHPFEQFHQIRFEPQHHHFGFGIAHPGIVFDHVWIIVHFYQAEKHKTFVSNAVASKSFNGRFDDSLLYFLHENFVGKVYRRHGAHSAGIEACITFANPFVILGFWQDLVVLAIGNHENRTFYSRKKFFDDHRITCFAEFAVQHLF